MLYLKVDNGDKMELIFKSDDKSEMNHYENKAIALWGIDNVMVTKNKQYANSRIFKFKQTW